MTRKNKEGSAPCYCVCHNPEGLVNACRHCIPKQFKGSASKPPHTHQHVIPVEWRNIPRTYHGVVDETGPHGYDTESYVSVTKLRCSCGDEVER